jgi:hypothetical protein
MLLSFAQLARHLRLRNTWNGFFDKCTFEPTLLTVPEVLGCLNAWSRGEKTIRDYVRELGAAGLPPKAQAYAESFEDGPV